MSGSESGSPQPVPTPRPLDMGDMAVPVSEERVPHRKHASGPFRQNHVSTVVLADVPIVALLIDGKERLCLAQISNTLLKGYSYNEIHNRRVALGITCVQCTPVQLEILRRAGAMPVSSRRCGMITKREAERLVKSFLEDTSPPKLPEDFAFEVQHECGWGCRGSFMPSRYNSSRAKCIKCSYCNMFFSPNKFIFHYHRTPDAKYSHPDAANFNSWRRHLTLTSEQEKLDLVYAWEDVKAMFNGGSRKRMSSFSCRSENLSDKTHCEEPKKQRFENTVERKSLRTPPMEYNPYPMFPTPSNGAPFPMLPSAFPPVSLALPVSSHPQERSPYVAPLRGTLPNVHLPNDFTASQRSRPMGNLFCSPFDKIWPKYPSLFFSGNHDLSFTRCAERLLPTDQADMRIIGFKSPKLSPTSSKRDNADIFIPSSHPLSRDPTNPLNGKGSDRGWCSAFRLVGNAGKQSRNVESASPDALNSKKSYSPESGSDSERESPKMETADEEREGSPKHCSEEDVCADEDSDEEISVKDPDVDIEDDHSDINSCVANSPHEADDNNVTEPEKNALQNAKKEVDIPAIEVSNDETHSNNSHRTETADSTSGSTDYSTLSREQLQTELQQEMEARKKVEKECSTIKETFEDQIKRAMQYREDIAKQLQAVRETLCTKLDQERKVRMTLQDRLKEAHDALHTFTCNMLASRHCTDCPVKEMMPR